MLGFGFRVHANEISVIDGDSIWWRRGGWGADGQQSEGAIKFRLAGFDTPEIRRHRQTTDTELAWGGYAAQRLKDVIDRAVSLHIKPKILGRRCDRFQNRVARLIVDGVDVAQIAVREQWGRAMKPGDKRTNWEKEAE